MWTVPRLLSQRRGTCPLVEITWRPKHLGEHWWAMAGQRIVGEVVWYERSFAGERYWCAWAGRDRVGGEFATDDEAKAAVQHALKGR